MKIEKKDLRKEYVRICPMTTWSDEEILDFLHQQAVPETEKAETEIIMVDSIEEYMKQHKCIYAEDFLQKLHAKING